MTFLKLNNDVEMPQLGLGVYKVPSEDIDRSVKHALEVGYRAIDTATFYENEEAIGKVLNETKTNREDIFITTKVWNSDQGYDNTIKAFHESLKKLGVDYIDLYLIHWPCPDIDLYVETYKALEKLYADGLVKAIGVSNFNIEHLERLLKECTVVPTVNQVECHPYLQQKELKTFCEKHNIKVEAWAPLARGEVFTEEIIKNLANKYNKTPAQVVLRWHIQEGTIVIPKSVTPSRISENFDIFDFELSRDDMNDIAKLNQGKRLGREPNDMNMK